MRDQDRHCQQARLKRSQTVNDPAHHLAVAGQGGGRGVAGRGHGHGSVGQGAKDDFTGVAAGVETGDAVDGQWLGGILACVEDGGVTGGAIPGQSGGLAKADRDRGVQHRAS